MTGCVSMQLDIHYWWNTGLGLHLHEVEEAKESQTWIAPSNIKVYYNNIQIILITNTNFIKILLQNYSKICATAQGFLGQTTLGLSRRPCLCSSKAYRHSSAPSWFLLLPIAACSCTVQLYVYRKSFLYTGFGTVKVICSSYNQVWC